MSALHTSIAPNFDGRLSADCALSQCVACGVFVTHSDAVVASTPDAARLLPLLAQKNLRIGALPQPLPEIIRQARQTAQAVTGRTLPARTDSAMPLQLCALPLGMANDGMLVSVVMTEAAQPESIQESIHRLDRLANIGLLSASLTHEIRNAFVGVRTFIELLLERHRDAELAGLVRREMLRIDSIVTQMLKFAAPAGPRMAVTQLHVTLEHALRMVQHQIEGLLIKLERNFAAKPDTIAGDDYQLEQAILNLLLNAIEAIGPEGTLSVNTTSVPPGDLLSAGTKLAGQSCVLLNIADTGAGVSPQNLPRLFEPFFTTKPHGTGLGLSIARRIVEDHGGTISVRSELGRGTTFTMLFPAR